MSTLPPAPALDWVVEQYDLKTGCVDTWEGVTSWLIVRVFRSDDAQPFVLRCAMLRTFRLQATTLVDAQIEAEQQALVMLRHAIEMLECSQDAPRQTPASDSDVVAYALRNNWGVRIGQRETFLYKQKIVELDSRDAS